jgi:teichuronic acid biosynthesis glycosyltransferase TuaG
MKFSVITPVFNGRQYIGRAIDSVLQQTYPEWEMIVVDNGSTDDTTRIVQEYATKDTRIRLISCPANSGSPAFPRNLGMKNASGAYIAFLDADDLFLPQKLYEVERFLHSATHAEIVCHGEQHVKNNRIVRTEYYGPYTTYKDLLLRNNTLSTSAVVMNKTCIGKGGYFCEDLKLSGFEDYDYWLRLSQSCRIVYLRKILGIYSVDHTSESLKIVANCRNAFEFIDRHYALWGRKNFYYATLFRRRKSIFSTLSARHFLRLRDYEKTATFAMQSISFYPFEIKPWIFLFIAKMISLCRKITRK